MTSSVATEPLITLDSVSKRFKDQIAIEGLSFSIDANEFVAIIGPSGCGKSTTLRIVSGLLPASSGRVLERGASVTKPIRDAAMVFQNPVLLPWRRTIDNILLSAEMRGESAGSYRERAHDLTRLAGLAGFERSLPHELSGGMQQRVSICRALLLEPALLLMDEPFGALDVLTREKMGFELQHIWESAKSTVLFVTHSITEAVLLADRAIVMSSRPGRAKAIVPIDLQRPRTVETLRDHAFVELCARLRAQLEESV